MADFMAANSLYIVLVIVLVVWAGILGYLYRIEGRIKKLEEQLER